MSRSAWGKEAMKVKEFIELLQKENPEAEVILLPQGTTEPRLHANYYPEPHGTIEIR
jgi:hypothetical protein